MRVLHTTTQIFVVTCWLQLCQYKYSYVLFVFPISQTWHCKMFMCALPVVTIKVVIIATSRLDQLQGVVQYYIQLTTMF